MQLFMVCSREIKQEENKVEVMERQPLGSMMNGHGNVQSVISENLKSMQTQKSLSEGHINLLNQLCISSLFSNNRGLI